LITPSKLFLKLLTELQLWPMLMDFNKVQISRLLLIACLRVFSLNLVFLMIAIEFLMNKVD